LLPGETGDVGDSKANASPSPTARSMPFDTSPRITRGSKFVLNKAITQSEKRMKKYMSMSIAEIASASEEKMKKYFDERDDRLFEILDKRIEERIDAIYVYMAGLKEETKLHFDAVAEKLFHDFGGGLGDVHAGVKDHEWRLKRLEMHTRIA
jgi:glucosamine 6-phosphate synthetase-like amidotransferase/phosphosugar isomerase protein